MSETGKRLEQLGITLPMRDRKGKGVMDVIQVGDLLFISARFLTDTDGGAAYIEKAGAGIDKETTYQTTRLCGLNTPAIIKDYVGELDRVDYVVETLGLANSTGDFSGQSAMMNGLSDLMVEVSGRKGQYARSVMGTYALEQSVPVTIEAIVRIRRQQ